MAKQITFSYDGTEYTLEYTRKSVEKMERDGFDVTEFHRKPITYLPQLFEGAFYAHHRFMKKDKIQEIFRALNVEKKYDKTEIMEMYLNTIYLSQNCYGVRAAAETYFGKQLSELTLNECAAIASIGKSPVKYDPIINPLDNLERRNLVLREMLAQGLITQEEFDAKKKQLLGL